MLPRLDDEDALNHEYWCRERVRGRKKMKQSQMLEESVEATGSSDAFNITGLENSMTPATLGIPAATNAKLEEPETEALIWKGVWEINRLCLGPWQNGHKYSRTRILNHFSHMQVTSAVGLQLLFR